ncbi:MAG: thioredoxin family protein [Mariprofundaceae bacterium]
MALVASIHVGLGSKIPDFELKDPDGKVYKTDDLFGPKGLLLVVTCNHCPYALAVWPRVIRHAKAFRELGVNTVAINPNIHPDFPEDAPSAMKEKIAEWGVDFPYLADEEQAVAEALDAQCTPDIYLYGANRKLYYHGRIDDYWKDEARVTQEELAPAVDALVAGQPAPQPQHPTIGCSIKWREDQA